MENFILKIMDYNYLVVNLPAPRAQREHGRDKRES